MPVGASNADLPKAQGPRRHDRCVGGEPLHGRSGVDVSRGRRGDSRPDHGRRVLASTLHRGRAQLQRARHRARALGQEDGDHRQQRIVGDHPHVQQRVRPSGRDARRLLPRSPSRRHRRGERARLPHAQQRRLQVRLRHHAGSLRRSIRRIVRHLGLARGAPLQAAVSSRATRSPRPTGASSPRSCASTRST